MQKIKIALYDTTLRDGMQTIGLGLDVEERYEFALLLAGLGIDVIEAGFPSASQVDYEATRRIANAFSSDETVVISAFAMANEGSVETAWQAVQNARRRRVHLGLGLSPTHIYQKFRRTPQELLLYVEKSVKFAAQFDWEVQFFTEDAPRTEPSLLYEALEIAINLGARYVNIPDTVGISHFKSYEDLISGILDNVRNISDAVVGVHTHNDLGLAVANSVAGILGGARQVEGTISGIGERAGNADLILFAAILAESDLGFCTGVDCRKIYSVAKRLEQMTGFRLSPNHPIVGNNVFTTCAGLHQIGLCREMQVIEGGKKVESFSYFPLDPGKYGREFRMVYNHLSGKEAISHRMRELGYSLDKELLDRFYDLFMAEATRPDSIKKSAVEADVFHSLAGKLEVPRVEAN